MCPAKGENYKGRSLGRRTLTRGPPTGKKICAKKKRGKRRKRREHGKGKFDVISTKMGPAKRDAAWPASTERSLASEGKPKGLRKGRRKKAL